MTRSSRGFIKRLTAACVLPMVALLLASGCAHRAEVSFLSPSTGAKSVAPKRSAAVLATTASPVAEAVAPADAWWLAENFAAERGDCETLVGSGGSMLPLYRDRTVLVVQRLPMAQLAPGMTVVFIGDSGRMVAHTLVMQTSQGWVAQGLANRERDRTPVQPRNYIGTVIKAFAPDARVASRRVSVVPASNSEATVGAHGARLTPETELALAPARAE